MLISKEMNAALNAQIGREFGSSLHYVAIAGYFASESLPELARHFFQQADEERAHALRFVRFLIDAGGRLTIPAIPESNSQYGSTEQAVRSALEAEIEVTREINALMDLASREGDHITQNALQWFVMEQLEELSTTETLLKMVQRAGEQGLLLVEDYIARHRPQGGPVTDVEVA